MKINTQEVQNGQHNDEIVWICHYHRPDLNKKPLRCVPPTRVVVLSNDTLSKNKKVYYSTSHFRPIKEDGKVLSKVISPVDNTGYRSRSGTPLYVFTEEQECIDEWNRQLEEHMDRFDVLIESAAQGYIDEKSGLDGMRRL